jgi:hypothetical protein
VAVDRLTVYADAILALGWAVEAEEAGKRAEAKRLRNLSTMVTLIPADAPPIDELIPDW